MAQFAPPIVTREAGSNAGLPTIPRHSTKGPSLTLTPAVSEVPGRIVRAAIALFSRQGYHGTSTREIARLADVSEVTVFRYFDHKEDIFLSALSSSFGTIRSRLELFSRGADSPKPQTMLPQIISLLFDITVISPDLPKLVAVAFLELHGKSEDVCLENLSPLFAAIAGYLSVNMEAGSLRALNPSIVTAAMALTVLALPELSKLMPGSSLSRLGGRASIDEYSKFWLKVLLPQPLSSFVGSEQGAGVAETSPRNGDNNSQSKDDPQAGILNAAFTELYD